MPSEEVPEREVKYPVSPSVEVRPSTGPIVYSSRRGLLPVVLQSQFLHLSHVGMFERSPLEDIVKAKHEVVVPTSHSVWLELPKAEIPNRTALYSGITNCLKQCRKYNKPFVMLCTTISTHITQMNGSHFAEPITFVQYLCACVSC